MLNKFSISDKPHIDPNALVNEERRMHSAAFQQSLEESLEGPIEPSIVQDGDFAQASASAQANASALGPPPFPVFGSLGDGGPSNAGWFAPLITVTVGMSQLDLTRVTSTITNMDPPPVTGSVYQDLNTTKGTSYALSFKVYGAVTFSMIPSGQDPPNPAFGSIGIKQLQVTVTDVAGVQERTQDGQASPQTLLNVSPKVLLPAAGTPDPVGHYTSYGQKGDLGGLLTFTAKSGKSRLEFTATSQQSFFLTGVVVA